MLAGIASPVQEAGGSTSGREGERELGGLRGKRVRFIVAYDIRDPRRLRQVAACLERSAVRVQKSVFVYEGDRAGLDAVCSELMTLIDIHEDRVQAWGIRDSHPTTLLDAAVGPPARAICVVVSSETSLVVGSDG